MIRTAERYIADVLSGKVVVSKTTRLTFERHRADLVVAPERGWYFDKRAAERVFDFCGFLKHSPDKRVWVPFVPEPWEAAIIYIIFGWKRKDETRRFNYAYIEIPKKNGKTTFAAVFADYLLFFDGEEEAEVYCAASVEKQARICFTAAKKMIEHSADLKKRQVFENIQSATVNRTQPLVVIITTAGRDKTLPCFNYRSLCIEILKGIKRQDDTFAIIYTPDEGDDWRDPAVWKKANPNYGVSVIPSRFKSEFEGAVNDPRKEVSFKTKNLNLWVDAPEVWITDEKWQLCSHGTKPEDMKGKKCYWGLDLASHVDINALALFFPDINGRPVAKMFYWIPANKLEEQKDRVDYASWKKQGFIRTTEGDVIDIDSMVADIMRISREFQCEGLGYDPARAYHGVIQGLIKEGFPADKMDEYSQGIMNMSPPSKEFEKIVVGGQLDHLNDPVLRWMMGNVMIYQDINQNIKPDKKRSRNKIDGIVALIIAIGEWMSVTYGKEDTEIYKDRELRMV